MRSAPVPPLSVPPSFLHIDPNLAADILLRVTTDVTGTWTLSVPVPNTPSWAGVAFQLQAAFPDPMQPHAIALTNGFAVTFGY